MNFESDYFQKFEFTDVQVDQYFVSAKHDLEIAVRSSAGHHFKIVEKMAELLGDDEVAILGNKMRQTRNFNLYDGGFFVSE